MTMDGKAMIARLEASGEILRGVAARVTEEDSLVKPAAGGWCVREVLGHLLSEEVEDFRARLDFVLLQPGIDWPKLDPEGRVREGGFEKRTAASLLADFMAERAKTLAWLRSLKSPDWSVGKVHPRIGNFRAGDLMAAWPAHDLLHARQIVRILHGLVNAGAPPFTTMYAGEW
jgi:hypothetical protein